MSTNNNDDTYIPGKGREIKKQIEDKILQDNLNKFRTQTSPPPTEDETEFVIDDSSQETNTNSKINWIEDVRKASEIMNDDDTPLPGGFGSNDDNNDDDDLDPNKIMKFKVDMSKGDSLVNLEDNASMQSEIPPRQVNEKCNQKQGVYCGPFRMMLGVNQCIHIELWGKLQTWTMWTLTNPDIEYASHAKIESIEDLQKARFNLPFRINRTILKYCPDCGGDLQF